MPASAQTAGTTALATAGSGAVVSGGATQEEGNLSVSIVKAGGQSYTETERHSKPINLKACIEGTIEVTINGGSNTAITPYLSVWYSTGNGMCNQGDRATRISGSMNCTRLTTDKDSTQLGGLSIFNTVVNIEPVCSLVSDQSHGQSDGPKTLYFLMLQSQGSTETAMVYRAFTITLDITPPDPPSLTTVGSGQTDIELGWNPPLLATRYWVLADYSQGALGATYPPDSDAGASVVDAGTSDGGISSAACSSNILKTHQSPRNIDFSVNMDGLFKHEIPNPARTYSFNGQDFRGVKTVPAVVIAEDLAGNLSLMSDVGCLKVEKTSGFWSRYKQGDAGGTADPGCACSVPGARTGGPAALTAVPVALLLAGAFARRRIRRRAR